MADNNIVKLRAIHEGLSLVGSWRESSDLAELERRAEYVEDLAARAEKLLSGTPLADMLAALDRGEVDARHVAQHFPGAWHLAAQPAERVAGIAILRRVGFFLDPHPRSRPAPQDVLDGSWRRRPSVTLYRAQHPCIPLLPRWTLDRRAALDFYLPLHILPPLACPRCKDVRRAVVYELSIAPSAVLAILYPREAVVDPEILATSPVQVAEHRVKDATGRIVDGGPMVPERRRVAAG